MLFLIYFFNSLDIFSQLATWTCRTEGNSFGSNRIVFSLIGSKDRFNCSRLEVIGALIWLSSKWESSSEVEFIKLRTYIKRRKKRKGKINTTNELEERKEGKKSELPLVLDNREWVIG